MMYTDDKNAQVVLSLLKEYGVKKIVVSPGTTNVPVSRSVQLDPWFEVYSVVDERSAAYFACGLADVSGEPVVISCTGATASRNYLPGLTEAFYRKLPIIALTSQHHTSDFGNLAPQVTDRTVSQNDIKKLSVFLPVVKDDEDYERCIISTNKALIAATTRGGGPVHINLHVVGDYSFTTKNLPKVRKIQYYNSTTIKPAVPEMDKILKNNKTAIFIGAHKKFDSSLYKSLEEFSDKYNAPVFVDQTSSYSGKNSVLISQFSDLKQSLNQPDLIIDMGSISGEYSAVKLDGVQTWRLSEDGEVHDRFHNQTVLFDGHEADFFNAFSQTRKSRKKYSQEVLRDVSNIIVPHSKLPLSNTYIAYQLSRNLPGNSNLHLGILNSLRNMNFFSLGKNINTSANVGGFGIDGAISTVIGQSMVDKSKLTFGLVGDLATFYDMNALGIRHITKNVRILLVNNSGGVEFRLNSMLETQWADESNEFISAGGHNGSIKGWAESMGFHYMHANNKREFDKMIKSFTSTSLSEFNKPVMFEVFTTIPDEQKAVSGMQEANRANGPEVSRKVRPSSRVDKKDAIKKIIPKSAKSIYRRIRGRE